MKLDVDVMSCEDTINSILHFQTDDNSLYWRETLFQVYPFLDKDKGLDADWCIRREYLSEQLAVLYVQVENELKAKADMFNQYWLERKNEVVKVFSDVFQIDCTNILDDMSAKISLNPICPRDIHLHFFTIFYRYGKEQFLMTAIHEMIHFVWFYIWHKHFKYSVSNYDAPHIEWLLSEMVIDTFVRHTDIRKFFDNSRAERPAYRYFYDMKINGELVLARLEKIYPKSASITDFMEKAIQYCRENEVCIRKQVL